MPNLVRSRGWGQVEPPPGAQIDWGHPLAQGLGEYVLFNSIAPPNLASGNIARPQASVTSGPRGGLRLSQNSGTTDWMTFKSRSVTNNTRTWVVWANLSAQPAAYSALIIQRVGNGGDSTSQTAGLTINSQTPVRLAYKWSDVAGEYDWVSGLTIPTGIDSMFAVAVGPAQAVGFVNGKFATNAVTHAAKLKDGTQKVGGDHQQALTRFIAGEYYAAAIWDRTLSMGELEALYAEPYAFIAPPGPKILYLGLASPAKSALGSAVFPLGITIPTGAKKTTVGVAYAPATVLVESPAKKTATGPLDAPTTVLATAPAKKTATAGAVAPVGVGLLAGAKKTIIGAVRAVLGVIGLARAPAIPDPSPQVLRFHDRSSFRFHDRGTMHFHE